MILPLVGVYFWSERKKSNLFFDHFFENTLPRYYSFCSEAISTPVEAEEKPEEVRVFLSKIQNLVENWDFSDGKRVIGLSEFSGDHNFSFGLAV